MIVEQGTELPLRFNCPACGATLTLPRIAAGIQGPCPKCWQEIVGPDPALGLSARLPSLPPPVAALPAEPVVPAADHPAATTAAPGAPLPAPAHRSRNALAWLVTVAALAAGGFYWATGGNRPEPPKPALAPPARETATAVPPAEPAAPTPSNVPNGVPPGTAVLASEAEATLRAFLEAPDCQARARFVIAPEDALPAMEAHAASHGNGPITTTTLGHLENAGPATIFKLGTPALPEGFPVAVVDTDEGPKVDWESFVSFHDDQFWKFVQGPAGSSGIFYVLAHPEPAAAAATTMQLARYRLSVPMPGRSLSVWIRKGSVGFARLRSVFAGSDGFEENEINRLAETGVPVVLSLAKRQAADGRTFVEIEDLVAVGWGPRVK